MWERRARQRARGRSCGYAVRPAAAYRPTGSVRAVAPPPAPAVALVVAAAAAMVAADLPVAVVSTVVTVASAAHKPSHLNKTLK